MVLLLLSCFRRKLAMHVKFWHSNWRQNITLVSTKRFTSERAIKIRVFAWYWVAFYARQKQADTHRAKPCHIFIKFLKIYYCHIDNQEVFFWMILLISNMNDSFWIFESLFAQGKSAGRTPILRATCHVKFVIMVRVIVITLDRTPQRPVVLVYHMLEALFICWICAASQNT